MFALCATLSYILMSTVGLRHSMVSHTTPALFATLSRRQGHGRGLNMWEKGRTRHDVVEACKGHIPYQAHIGKKQNKRGIS